MQIVVRKIQVTGQSKLELISSPFSWMVSSWKLHSFHAASVVHVYWFHCTEPRTAPGHRKTWNAGPQDTQECCCIYMYFANVRWGFIQFIGNAIMKFIQNVCLNFTISCCKEFSTYSFEGMILNSFYFPPIGDEFFLLSSPFSQGMVTSLE